MLALSSEGARARAQKQGPGSQVTYGRKCNGIATRGRHHRFAILNFFITLPFLNAETGYHFGREPVFTEWRNV